MIRFWSISAIPCSRNDFLRETESESTARTARTRADGPSMGDHGSTVAASGTDATGEAHRAATSTTTTASSGFRVDWHGPGVRNRTHRGVPRVSDRGSRKKIGRAHV